MTQPPDIMPALRANTVAANMVDAFKSHIACVLKRHSNSRKLSKATDEQMDAFQAEWEAGL